MNPRVFTAVLFLASFILSHGERTKTGSGAIEYNDAIFRAYRTGKEHPFYYDTVWDG